MIYVAILYTNTDTDRWDNFWGDGDERTNHGTDAVLISARDEDDAMMRASLHWQDYAPNHAVGDTEPEIGIGIHWLDTQVPAFKGMILG